MKYVKKILLLIVLLFINVYANEEIMTPEKLAQAEMINKPFSNLVLAQAYEVGMPEKGIPQDIEKAIELYQKVYDANKDPIASSKLGMYYFTKENIDNKDYKSEDYFKNGISKEELLTNEFNGVMYGVVLYSKKRYDEAIASLLLYSEKFENPTAEIYLGFSYNALKNVYMANKYLTRACTNPKSTQDILKFCNQSTAQEDLNKILDDAQSCVSE